MIVTCLRKFGKNDFDARNVGFMIEVQFTLNAFYNKLNSLKVNLRRNSAEVDQIDTS